MAGFPSLDQFADGETPNEAKMNQLVDAVEAAFSAGIQGSNMAWPLVAGGDIDLDGNNIFGFSSVNGGQHPTTGAEFIDAVENADSQGKLIVINPGVTITLATGVTVSHADVTIMGYGPDSKIIFTETDGTAITFSGDNGRAANFSLDGDAISGTCAYGINIGSVSHTSIESVFFEGVFTSGAVFSSATGGADFGTKIVGNKFNVATGIVGYSFVDTNITDNFFEGPTAIDISGSQPLARLIVKGNHGQGAASIACSGVTSGPSIISNNSFTSLTVEDLDQPTVSGNHISVDLTMTSIDEMTVTENNIVGDVDLTSCDYSMFSGNYVGGSATLISCDNGGFLGNYIDGGFNLTTSDYSRITDNRIRLATVITTSTYMILCSNKFDSTVTMTSTSSARVMNSNWVGGAFSVTGSSLISLLSSNIFSDTVTYSSATVTVSNTNYFLGATSGYTTYTSQEGASDYRPGGGT